MSNDAEYTVGFVARRLGIPVATLRSWNQRFGIGPGRHRPGRHRRYTESDLAVAARMVELVEAGVRPASAARAAMAAAGAIPRRGDVEPLLAAAFGLDAVEVPKLLCAHIAHYGVAATWDQLCRPAFAVIVDAQQRGAGCIDVEHLLSWAVATSLHRAVPPLKQHGTRATIIVACADGETHVLPLEVLRAALAERGVVAIMLGAAVPESAVMDAVRRREGPVTVLLWSQTAATADVAAVLRLRAAGVRVLPAGPGWAASSQTRDRLYVASLADAMKLLA